MIVKVVVGKEHQSWLDQEDNTDRWYGNITKPFKAMQRRILITQWVEKKRFVEKTRCLMTPDGSHDEKT